MCHPRHSGVLCFYKQQNAWWCRAVWLFRELYADFVPVGLVSGGFTVWLEPVKYFSPNFLWMCMFLRTEISWTFRGNGERTWTLFRWTLSRADVPFSSKRRGWSNCHLEFTVTWTLRSKPMETIPLVEFLKSQYRGNQRILDLCLESLPWKWPLAKLTSSW